MQGRWLVGGHSTGGFVGDARPNPYIEEFLGLKRVKFGPYRTREEADAARETLGEMGLAGIVVVYR